MDEATLAALIASTAKAGPSNEGWFTSAEFAVAAKRGRDWACRQLSAMVSAGHVACERRTTTNVLGELSSKPMYRRIKGDQWPSDASHNQSKIRSQSGAPASTRLARGAKHAC